MFLLFIKVKFLRKNGVSEKIKAHFPQHSPPPIITTIVQPPLFNFIQKILVPPPFKREGRYYEFYMRDDKGETIKLLQFYMMVFLFTEL